MHKQVSLCLSFKRRTNKCWLWLKLCDVWEGFNCCRGVQGGLIKKQVECDVHEWAASVIRSHPCRHLPSGYCDILLKRTVKLFIIGANAQRVQPWNKTDTHTHTHKTLCDLFVWGQVWEGVEVRRLHSVQEVWLGQNSTCQICFCLLSAAESPHPYLVHMVRNCAVGGSLFEQVDAATTMY